MSYSQPSRINPPAHPFKTKCPVPLARPSRHLLLWFGARSRLMKRTGSRTRRQTLPRKKG
ncbi:hypothetical protein E2C01_031004 [Portunus trituberculatus]|uniref:Uncharacterized protein n=1 Tax=Portunus trituberculatus TaxID=210409 RepID=A0A5B7ETC9_PORTR|nr:hypothetical protein [Portunus trituberculatus]